MIDVERITLHLPPGFESRADAIAHLLAEFLAPLAAAGPIERKHLALSPPPFSRDATDRDIARSIARELARRLGVQLE